MDAEARSLERQAYAGVPTDRAAALMSRVRAGIVNPDRVMLSAYAGHEIARLAIERHGIGINGCPRGWTPRECAGFWWEHDTTDADQWLLGLPWFERRLNLAPGVLIYQAISPWVRAAIREVFSGQPSEADTDAISVFRAMMAWIAEPNTDTALAWAHACEPVMFLPDILPTPPGMIAATVNPDPEDPIWGVRHTGRRAVAIMKTGDPVAMAKASILEWLGDLR